LEVAVLRVELENMSINDSIVEAGGSDNSFVPFRTISLPIGDVIDFQTYLCEISGATNISCTSENGTKTALKKVLELFKDEIRTADEIRGVVEIIEELE